MSKVEYRDIPGFEGYKAGSDGTIWSCWRRKACGARRGTASYLSHEWHVVRPATKNNGYLQVTLCNGNKKRISAMVHRCVLSAFVGMPRNGMQACHIDGNKKNNAINNLRWDTALGNMSDQYKHGTRITHCRGAAKLSEDQVAKIRERLANCKSQRLLAAEFGVTQGVVSRIKTGKAWF